MSEAPERIWADGNQHWDSGSWGLNNEFDGDVEYIRADLVEAAVKRALERAATTYEDGFPAWDVFGAATRAIRALDPAQFVDGEKR